MQTRFVVLPALVLSSCTLILDEATIQCTNDGDCAFLEGSHTCRRGVCQPDETANDCPQIAAYTWNESTALLRNACMLPSEHRGSIFNDGENEAEVMSPVSLPFDWCFYGEPVSNVWVGDNGYVTFGDEAPMATLTDVGLAHSLGESGIPAPGVSAFWDDLRPGPSGVCAAVEGTPGLRVLWLTWQSACFEDGSGSCTAESNSSLTFTVGLEEGTGNVILGYPEMLGQGPLAERALGQTATIGITSDLPRGCTADACGSDGLCDDGTTPCGYTEVSAQRALERLPTGVFQPG